LDGISVVEKCARFWKSLSIPWAIKSRSSERSKTKKPVKVGFCRLLWVKTCAGTGSTVRFKYNQIYGFRLTDQKDCVVSAAVSIRVEYLIWQPEQCNKSSNDAMPQIKVRMHCKHCHLGCQLSITNNDESDEILIRKYFGCS
jgi:hypothetical protein